MTVTVKNMMSGKKNMVSGNRLRRITILLHTDENASNFLLNCELLCCSMALFHHSLSLSLDIKKYKMTRI